MMWAPEWEASIFLAAWATFGISPFTAEGLAKAVAESSRDQVRVALSRLVKRGWLIRLRRGRYVAKPPGRIMASLALRSLARNELLKAGIQCPAYLHGSAADLLALEGSDIDLLIVSSSDWDELERKLPGFHLTFITPERSRDPDLFIYLVLKRGVPLLSKLEVPELSFDPEPLLKEALEVYESAWANGEVYELQLLDAAGLAAKYLLYRSGVLPPTSSVGAILELAKLDEAHLELFRELEAHHVAEVSREVIGWARRTK